MSETLAVPAEWLDKANAGQHSGGQPLCPACPTGYLHPFKVTIGLGAWGGVNYLEGWVAVCQGNRDQLRREAHMRSELRAAAHDADTEVQDPDEDPEHPPCGFSLPMQPHHRGQSFLPGVR